MWYNKVTINTKTWQEFSQYAQWSQKHLLHIFVTIFGSFYNIGILQKHGEEEATMSVSLRLVNLSRNVEPLLLYVQFLTHWAGWFYWGCREWTLFMLHRKSCCWSIIYPLLLEFVHVKHDFTQQEQKRFSYICLVCREIWSICVRISFQ